MIHEYHHDRKHLYFCWQQNITTDLQKKYEPALNISGLHVLIHTNRFFSGGRKKKISFASKKGSYVNNEYVNNYNVPYITCLDIFLKTKNKYGSTVM